VHQSHPVCGNSNGGSTQRLAYKLTAEYDNRWYCMWYWNCLQLPCFYHYGLNGTASESWSHDLEPQTILFPWTGLQRFIKILFIWWNVHFPRIQLDKECCIPWSFVIWDRNRIWHYRFTAFRWISPFQVIMWGANKTWHFILNVSFKLWVKRCTFPNASAVGQLPYHLLAISAWPLIIYIYFLRMSKYSVVLDQLVGDEKVT
jgi:hypothetical protein